VRLMILFYRAFSLWGHAGSQVLSHEQRGEERGAGGHGVDEDVLVRGVGAMADGAEAVERGGADRSGEIAVRAPTGCAFSE
jgi:hypothetical protein